MDFGQSRYGLSKRGGRVILWSSCIGFFETAAQTTFRDVFPEALVEGYLFHNRQAVERNIGRPGLQPVYRRVPPYDGPEFAAVHRWARQLIALAVAPVQFLKVVWNNCLTNPPRTGDARVDANLLASRDHCIHQAQLWNHYDRDGPRTTNHAEGYHRGLFDTRRRLPLGIFLGKMQELHNSVNE